MKKISKSLFLTSIFCVLFFFNFYGCTSTNGLIKTKRIENQTTKDLSENFCKDCKGPHCLRFKRVIFSSNKGANGGKKNVIYIKKGATLMIEITAFCCKWPVIARDVILRATISDVGTETGRLSDLRTGQWDIATVLFEKVPLGTYDLKLQLRASTKRGMDERKFILKVE